VLIFLPIFFSMIIVSDWVTNSQTTTGPILSVVQALLCITFSIYCFIEMYRLRSSGGLEHLAIKHWRMKEKVLIVSHGGYIISSCLNIWYLMDTTDTRNEEILLVTSELLLIPFFVYLSYVQLWYNIKKLRVGLLMINLAYIYIDIATELRHALHAFQSVQGTTGHTADHHDLPVSYLLLASFFWMSLEYHAAAVGILMTRWLKDTDKQIPTWIEDEHEEDNDNDDFNHEEHSVSMGAVSRLSELSEHSDHTSRKVSQPSPQVLQQPLASVSAVPTVLSPP